jgi:DNA-binding NarL/FixJ family response regulator
MEPISVLIADDHSHFRAGLRALLAAVPDVEVVGEASGGDEAVALAARLQPDVILMDLHMPGLSGIEATARILHTSPHIRVLVVSMFDDDDSVFAALQAGAGGYLVKGARKAEIVRSIRAVAAGEAIFGPAIATRLMHYFATPHPNALLNAPSDAFPGLTEREREILVLIAQHHTNPEIARRLQVSPKTVRNHVSNIFTKLQVATRAQAIIRAREAGLG